MRLRGWLLALMLMLCGTIVAQPDRVYKSLKEVTNPADVYILQLRHKRLKAIPPEVYAMSNLQQLDLRGNRIAQLPDSISKLQHLQRLELSRNPLMGLPAGMAEMSELKELILWSTYVTDMPEELGKLDDTLEVIDLRHCPMTIEDQEAMERLIPSVKKIWDYACNCGD